MADEPMEKEQKKVMKPLDFTHWFTRIQNPDADLGRFILFAMASMGAFLNLLRFTRATFNLNRHWKSQMNIKLDKYIL